ncbi:hypothetical protein C27AD_12351 [Salinisphaera hydrothermalis C27AD]
MYLIARDWHDDDMPPLDRRWAPAWGTDYEIWTSLIWQLEIVDGLYRDSSAVCDITRVHANATYDELLPLPRDEVSSQQRLEDLEDWFEQLAELGYVIDTFSNTYEAGFYPPADFRPYHATPLSSASAY